MTQCPDCNLSMTQHTIGIYSKKELLQRSSPRKVDEEVRKCGVQVNINPERSREQPPGLVKPIKTLTRITDEIVKEYKDNPGIVTNYFRNGRIMKTRRKQMHVRSLLNNAFLEHFNSILYYIQLQKHGD